MGMMLSGEVLEGLLMDRALGQLSPEVGALLEVYLAGDAVAAAEGEKLKEVVGLAGVAMGEKVERALPVFKAREVRGARQRRSMWRMVGAVGGMAACLVVGVMVGRRPAVVVEKPVAVVTPVVKTKEAARATDFWSAQRLEQLARAPVAERGGAGASAWMQLTR